METPPLLPLQNFEKEVVDRVEGCGLTSSSLGQGQLLGCYEERTESLCFVKSGKFLDELTECRFFKMNSTPYSLVTMSELLFRLYLVQILSRVVAIQLWSSSDSFNFLPVHSFSRVYVKCCVA